MFINITCTNPKLVSEASASSECREDINELTGNEKEKSVDEFSDKRKQIL